MKKTVQLVPEALFFVLRDMYGMEKPFTSNLPGFPSPALIVKVKLRGKILFIAVHKDYYFSNLLVYKEDPVKFVTTKPLISIFGGKVSGILHKEIYHNRIYHRVVTKTSPDFDPAFVISVVFGELAKIMDSDPSSVEDFQLHEINRLELYSAENSKEKGIICF